jgi:hypothetical protein
MKRVANLDQNAFLEGGRLIRKRGQEDFQVNFSMRDALNGSDTSQIPLQAGDAIFIPLEPLTVQVKGEVVSPGDVIWKQGMSAEDFIEASGGYTITSDEKRVVITYANGSKATMLRAEHDPDPGATIVVPFKKEAETDWYKFWATVATILGAVAQVALVIIVTKK